MIDRDAHCSGMRFMHNKFLQSALAHPKKPADAHGNNNTEQQASMSQYLEIWHGGTRWSTIMGMVQR